MKKRFKSLSISLAAVGAVLAIALATIAGRSGEFKSIEPAFRGTCRTVALGGSVDDIQIDRERGIAYLSFLDRASLQRGEAVNGSIMLLDLNLAEPGARAALAFDPANFRPHGIYLWQRPGRQSRLFAISHQPNDVHVVEIAEESTNGGFFPKETIRSAAFVHPNAIAAIGPQQFYIANDSAATSRVEHAAEILFRRGHSTLIYFDGTDSRIVDTGLRSAVGIALNANTTRLYVAEALEQQLRVYQRDLATGALELEELVPLGSTPDNLNVDAEGVVWIAAHPKLLTLLGHARNPAGRAPTQVLRFDPRKPRPAEGEPDTRVSQIYLNAGEQISAGTVAAAWRDEFLIGALRDHKVLICKTNP